MDSNQKDKFDLAVETERNHQREKWGDQNHPDGTGGDFNVYLASNSKNLCDLAFKQGFGTWLYVLEEEVAEVFAESDPERLREELIQVAAVCKAWVECIDRRTK